MYEEDFLMLIGSYDGFTLDSTSDEEVMSLMKLCFYHGCIHVLDRFWNDMHRREGIRKIVVRNWALANHQKLLNQEIIDTCKPIWETLDNMKIPYVVAKGIAYDVLLYKDRCRPFSDCDIWIDSNYVDVIIGVLTRNGFSESRKHEGIKLLSMNSRRLSMSHLKEYIHKNGVVIDLHQSNFDGLLFNEIMKARVWQDDISCYITNPIDTFLIACSHLFIHADSSMMHWLYPNWVDSYPLKNYLDVLDSYCYVKGLGISEQEIICRANTLNGEKYLGFAISALLRIFPWISMDSALGKLAQKYDSYHDLIVCGRTVDKVRQTAFTKRDYGKMFLQQLSMRSQDTIAVSYVFPSGIDDIMYCDAWKKTEHYEFISTECRPGDFWDNHILENFGLFPTSVSCKISMLWNEEYLYIRLDLSLPDDVISPECLINEAYAINVSIAKERNLQELSLLKTEEEIVFTSPNGIGIISAFSMSWAESYEFLLSCDFVLCIDTPKGNHILQHIGCWTPITAEKDNFEKFPELWNTMVKVRLERP